MLKKVLLGVLFVGLIGVLVAGAVIRTVGKTERVAEAQGLGHGYGHAETDESGQGYGRSSGGAGANAAVRLGQGRGGNGGRGREDAPGDQEGVGQANVEEWLTIQGTVVSVDADTLVVQRASGEQVTVENRAWWFTQEQGFSAQIGDRVTLVGFHEGDRFEVGRIDNATNGQIALVRDESGRPLWAGRGRHGS